MNTHNQPHHLEGYHIRILEHLNSVMCIFGWEEYDDVLEELENWGLVKGEWHGSLEYPARPMWTLTKEGLMALNTRKDVP